MRFSPASPDVYPQSEKRMSMGSREEPNVLVDERFAPLGGGAFPVAQVQKIRSATKLLPNLERQSIRR